MEKDHSQGDQSIFVIYVPVDNNFPTIFVDNNLQKKIEQKDLKKFYDPNSEFLSYVVNGWFADLV